MSWKPGCSSGCVQWMTWGKWSSHESPWPSNLNWMGLWIFFIRVLFLICAFVIVFKLMFFVGKRLSLSKGTRGWVGDGTKSDVAYAFGRRRDPLCSTARSPFLRRHLLLSERAWHFAGFVVSWACGSKHEGWFGMRPGLFCRRWTANTIQRDPCLNTDRWGGKGHDSWQWRGKCDTKTKSCSCHWQAQGLNSLFVLQIVKTTICDVLWKKSSVLFQSSALTVRLFCQPKMFCCGFLSVFSPEGPCTTLLKKWSVSITDHFWPFFPKWVQPPRPLVRPTLAEKWV